MNKEDNMETVGIILALTIMWDMIFNDADAIKGIINTFKNK